MPIISILAVFVVVAGIAAFGILYVLDIKKRVTDKTIKKTASKEAAMKDANKRLAKNPRDVYALAYLGDLAYQEEDWKKALEVYEVLAEMPILTEDLNQTEANVRAGIAAMRLDNGEAAYKFFVVARALDQHNFEVNYQLGFLEYQHGAYEKAEALLRQSLRVNADYIPAVRQLGLALFKLNEGKEALNYLRRTLAADPNDKEALFTLAECYTQAGDRERALKIYSHLRPDARWGPESCLCAGLINAEEHQDEQAAGDFEIGLKHQGIRPDVKIELTYQLANVDLRMQDINAAMKRLQEVQTLQANYKNTPELIEKYKELNANKNLQIFIMGASGDFIALCRKIVMTYFAKAKVKITKTVVTRNDWADLCAEVDTPKWSDTIMFRFIRTQGAIGEFVLRDFYSHLKDVKASKGICVAIGAFSEEAKKFTDSRLIDLIEKDKLMLILNRIDSKMQAAVPELEYAAPSVEPDGIF